MRLKDTYLKDQLVEKLKRAAQARGTTPEAILESALAELEAVPNARKQNTRRTDVSMEVPAFAFARRACHPLD